MTRSEALRILLKCIFDNYTISEDNGAIVSGVSLYQNCSYTLTSYNHFKELFEVAFLKSDPRYSDNKPFDRKQALSNAQKYLSAYGINIPESLSAEDKTNLIFKTLVERILRAIVIDEESKKKDVSKDDNINKIFFKSIIEALNEVRRYNTMSHFSCLNAPISPEIIDTDYNNEPDKCNFSAPINCNTMESYKVLQMIRNISVLIPIKSEDESYNVGDDFTQLSDALICGKYSDKTGNYKSFPLFFFPDEDILFSSIKWKTYVNEKDIISKSKSSGLSSTIKVYTTETRQRAEKQTEEYLIEYLKSYYVETINKFEHLISSIISSKGKNINLDDINVLTDKIIMKEYLFSQCLQMFWNFGMAYMLIEEAYENDICKGLYITIQNTIIEVTDLLNINGENIAMVLKNVLPADSLKKHKSFIKRNSESKKLSAMIEREKRLYSEHGDWFKEPEAIPDYFYCIRKNTFYNLRSALYKYYGLLNSQKG